MRYLKIIKKMKTCMHITKEIVRETQNGIKIHGGYIAYHGV